MNLVIWLSCGALIGWVAARLAAPGVRQSPWLSVAAGAVGALVGGGLVSPLMGIGDTPDAAFEQPLLMMSVIGAVVLVAVVHVLRRGSLR